HPRLGGERGDRRLLPRHRHRRVQQHLLEHRLRVDQCGEAGEVLLDGLEVGALLDADVEEGAGVAGGRGFVRHLAMLAKTFTSTSIYNRNYGRTTIFTSGRAASTVPMRRPATPADSNAAAS